MLVHSFSPTHARLADFQRFATRLGAAGADADKTVSVGEREGVALFLGWVSGVEPSP